MAVRMPNVPSVSNPDGNTISATMNQSTAIRIDDSGVGVRKTWSSAKIQEYAQTSEAELVYQFVSNYGELYFSDYDEHAYNEWTEVIRDAITAMNKGEPFYVAWSDKRPAQVVNADLDSEPRMTVLIDGRSFAMSDTGIVETPIYSIVLQYDSKDLFPRVGTAERLYIDTEHDELYYWNNSLGYQILSSSKDKLHKLTFGAGQEYVYDGSEDVTVPVYMGAISI